MVNHPTTVYKFLRRSDIPFIMDDQTLIVGSSAYYRREYYSQEVADRGEKINDPNEGVITQVQDRPITQEYISPQEREYIRELGVNIDRPGVNMVMEGNSITRRLKNFHMICFGCGPLDELVATFCSEAARRPGFEPYDACVRIDNLPDLVPKIMREGVVRRMDDSTEVSIFQLWTEAHLGWVRYQRTAYGWNEPRPYQDGFIKPKQFADQFEYRMVLLRGVLPEARPGDLAERYIVKVPGLTSYVHEVDIAPYL